jgi:poly-gamma-glutamate synthesis protein (capsule biosynthesis protein)
MDMGEEGVETTLNQLHKEGIIAVGTNRQEEDRQKGRIIEKGGIKIGFAAATFGLNGKAVPLSRNYLVNVVKFHRQDGTPDLTLLRDQISLCRDQGCDLIIASLHWGYEYEFFPRLHQVEVAHEIIESGADVIIAHHSHVIQPVEYYRTRRDPDRIAVIAYSLGNLTTPFSAPHLVLSQLLELVFARGVFKGSEKTYIEKAEVIPVMQVESESAGLPVILIKKLSDMVRRVEQNAAEEDKEYIGKVAGYADFIPG